MSARDQRRLQRPIWAALSVVFVLGMMTSLFLAGRARQSAEATATAQAQLAVQTDLAPLLTPSDVAQPVTGARYQTLSALVTRRLLSEGPSDGVAVYRGDGTVVFDLERSMVGTRAPELRARLENVLRAGREGVVEGDAFHAFVPVRLKATDEAVAVADVTRPYEPLWVAASRSWRIAAIAFAALSLPAVGMLVVSFTASRPSDGSRAVAPGRSFAPAPERRPDGRGEVEPTAPTYEHPGFRAEVEARRRAEQRAARAEEATESIRRELERVRSASAPDAGEAAKGARRLAEAQEQARRAEADRRNAADKLQRAELQRAELYERLESALAEVAQATARGEEPADAALTARLLDAEEEAARLRERASSFERRIEESARELETAREQVRSVASSATQADGLVAEATERAAHAEDSARVLEERVRVADERAAAAEESARMLEERARDAERRAAEADEATAAMGDRVRVAEEQAAQSDEVGRMLEARARDADERSADLRTASAERAAEVRVAVDRATAAEEELGRVLAERDAEKAAREARRDDEPDLADVLRVTRERLQHSGERVQAAEERARAAERELEAARGRVDELEGVVRREKLQDALQNLRHDEELAPPLEERRASAPFMKALSLDARNSVAAIQGLVLAMKHAQKPEDQPAMLRRMNAHARKLDRLVGDLLDADRLARGEIELKVRRTDIEALAKRVIEECAFDGDRVICIEGERTVVAVDPIRVEGILVALLNNAVDRSRPRHEVVVRVGPRDDGALISVEDDEPSSDASLSPVVARFADVHGGWAIVESRPDGGSAFRVYLPDQERGRPSTTIAPERDTIEIREAGAAQAPQG
jgi:hypothetical protein